MLSTGMVTLSDRWLNNAEKTDGRRKKGGKTCNNQWGIIWGSVGCAIRLGLRFTLLVNSWCCSLVLSLCVLCLVHLQVIS